MRLMKKNYVQPENELFEVKSKCALLADSNHLENGTDEDAGVKMEMEYHDEIDEIWK